MTRTVALPAPPRASAADLAAAAAIRDGRWCYVGEEYRLGTPPPWRTNPSRDKEWRIAQHKQYCSPQLLHAFTETGDEAYLRLWVRTLDDWLTVMGTGEDVQSDAQVEALRLRNWVDSWVLLAAARDRGALPDGVVPADLVDRWLQRMGEEAAYVAGHLKAARNHRTFQLHSVFLVAVCLPGVPDREALLAFAVRELTDNLLTDLLPDGVQVEMSTHYHQLVTEVAVAFVDLARRNDVALSAELERRVHAAARWAAWLTWPDGSIPLVGDSDDGDHRAALATAADLFDDPTLRWVASRGQDGRPPDRTALDLPDSGYVVFTDGWGDGPESYGRRTHVLYDAARLGDGAHAHYDLFSFTLHAGGRPVVVDPGRYTYRGDPDADGVDWRHVFKSTAAHNTVVVDGRDQTRHVSRHRHGPAAAAVDRRVHLGRTVDWVVADAHSAEYTPVHTRVAALVGGEYLLLVDRVVPGDDARHTATAALHLPAGWHPSLVSRDGWAELRDGPAEVLVWTGAVGAVRLEDGWVSTEYGRKDPAPVLRAAVAGRGTLVLVTAIAWPGPTGPRRLRRLSRLDTAGTVFAVELESGGRRTTDTLWLAADRGVAARAPAGRVTAGGRFVLVRSVAEEGHAGNGATRWVTGEDLDEVTVPGLSPADREEWTAG